MNGETNAVAFVTLTGKNEKNKSYVTASVSGRDISYVILNINVNVIMCVSLLLLMLNTFVLFFCGIGT